MSLRLFEWAAASSMAATRNRNRHVLLCCVGLVAGMHALSFAAVPLYDLFCRVTGFGGTTQQAKETTGQTANRIVRIRFDASVDPNLQWEFQPVQRELSMRVGESALAFYRARNVADAPIIGTATFNVTPLKVGKYFNKIECFCFTEQKLEPGKFIDMPVTFFVDPEIMNNPNLDDVKLITLSYTFFEVEEETDAKQAELGEPANQRALQMKI